MRRYFILILFFCTATIYSQNTSSIKGKLTDKEFNNEPLAFANISIKGSINETTSNLDGSYVFENLKPGQYVLIYNFVGYETQEKNVTVTDEKAIEANVSLGATSLSLNKVVTSALSKKQESETELTSFQTKA